MFILRCLFAATMTEISHHLQLKKRNKKQDLETPGVNIWSRVVEKFFWSSFGFIETPKDESRCSHNENIEETLCLAHWCDHEIRTFLRSSSLSHNEEKYSLSCLVVVGSSLKNVQPRRTSFLASTAEKLAASSQELTKIIQRQDDFSSSSQKAPARSSKEKVKERAAQVPTKHD